MDDWIQDLLEAYRSQYGDYKMTPELARVWVRGIEAFIAKSSLWASAPKIKQAIEQAFEDNLLREKRGFTQQAVIDSALSILEKQGLRPYQVKGPLPPQKPMPEWTIDILQANEALSRGQMGPAEWYAYAYSVYQENNALDAQTLDYLKKTRDQYLREKPAEKGVTTEEQGKMLEDWGV